MCKSKNSHKMVSWIDKKDTKLYKMHVFLRHFRETNIGQESRVCSWPDLTFG